MIFGEMETKFVGTFIPALLKTWVPTGVSRSPIEGLSSPNKSTKFPQINYFFISQRPLTWFICKLPATWQMHRLVRRGEEFDIIFQKNLNQNRTAA